MNQARTTYQSDYSPFDWLQNNVISDMNEFCSTENVDECLKYISQEFSALGYPSIYSNSTDCPFAAINCDIVKFLNATFELLRSNSEYIQAKDDLESRNQRLCSDLNVFNKKNSLLKTTLEQNERKLASALERERQLKEKNEQLSQLLKCEKEETKKLTTQLRQQKIAYQHEIRKYENNMNHIKTKLNQLLSDKNPNKKMANITTSHTLTRNTGQRGKWKTGSAATTAIEDMYNSVISTYETRSKDLYKELISFRQCMQSVLLKILEMISALQNGMDGKIICSTTSEEFILNEIKKESRDVRSFEDKFKYLLCILKETVTKKTHEVNKNLEDQVTDLKLKLSEYEKVLEKCKDSPQGSETECTNSTGLNKEEVAKSFAEDFIKREKMKLESEKLALSKSLENIQKEKAEISAQKLAILRLAIQQKVQPSSWHQALNTSPSISVITSRSGSTRISSANQLKSSLSTPEQIGQSNKSFSPQWISDEQVVDTVSHTKSDSILLKESISATQSAVCSPLTADVKFSDSGLPSWAINKTEVQSIVIDAMQNITVETSQNVSTDEIELPSESSSEEVNLLRLRAAVQDIEKRRTNIS